MLLEYSKYSVCRVVFAISCKYFHIVRTLLQTLNSNILPFYMMMVIDHFKEICLSLNVNISFDDREAASSTECREHYRLYSKW